jgi:transcriptional regulator with XRE-family HTH domain
VGQAVKQVREWRQLGVRELSRKSGVAAPQISRLEKGDVIKAADNLVALARAFGENPIPLLVMAGYITGEDARARLQTFLAVGNELEEEWLSRRDRPSLEAARSTLEDAQVSDEVMRLLAYEVFLMGETTETLWDDAYLALGGQGENARDLQELVSLWPSLVADRQRRVLEFLRDQARLSQQEDAEEFARFKREEQLGPANGGENR